MKMQKTSHDRVRWLCVCAMLMAVNIVMSSFSVPVPGGHLYLNDIIIDTAAILLDPLGAFLVGGVGAFLGDFFFYPTPMFVSLVTRGLQAVAISVIARGVLKHKPVVASSLGVGVGALISVIGYSLGRAFIYATPEAALLKLPYQLLMAFGGGVIALILCWKSGVEKQFRRWMEA